MLIYKNLMKVKSLKLFEDLSNLQELAVYKSNL